jgi:hypothetical protein
MTSATFAATNGKGGLPLNKWVEVEASSGAGARQQAAVVWLPKRGKYLVICGQYRPANKARRPYEIVTFDPKTRQWENQFPAGKEGAWGPKQGNAKAPGHVRCNGKSTQCIMLKDARGNARLPAKTALSNYFAFDPEAERLYVCLAGHQFKSDLSGKVMPVLTYDVPSRKWELLSGKGPKTNGHAFTRPEMQGTRMIFDPVNKELLFLGGHCPNSAKGTIGDWKFVVGSRSWVAVQNTSQLLDPLREDCETAERGLRAGLAAARNVFYAGLAPGEEAKRVKSGPARDLAATRDLVAKLAKSLASAKAKGWEAEGIRRAAAKVDAALKGLSSACAALGAGKVSAAELKATSDALWALDEAADGLRASPGPRTGAAAAYDPVRKCIVLFGGYHGDYVVSDTWVYDCASREWRQVWPKVVPKPRTGARMFWLPSSKRLAMVGGKTILPRFRHYDYLQNLPLDAWVFEAGAAEWRLIHSTPKGQESVFKRKDESLASAMAAGEGDVLLGLSNYHAQKTRSGGLRNSATWLMKLGGTPQAAESGGAGALPGSRVYHSVVPEYNPDAFDAAPRGDPKATAAWLAKLRPNTWTPVPASPRSAGESSWGTATYDPKRDCVYFSSGGHCADNSNAVHVYHPAINRWHIPFRAGCFQRGIDFDGRASWGGHVYLGYCYDPASSRLVLVGRTVGRSWAAYDPEVGDWVKAGLCPPIGGDVKGVRLCGTSRGAVLAQGSFALLDPNTWTWKKLPVGGKLATTAKCDQGVLVWDSKRDVLYMSNAGNGVRQLWRYDMKTGAAELLKPGGSDTIARDKTFVGRARESVYIPELDLVLFNNFEGGNQNAAGRQIAYDPAKNRWVLLGVSRPASKKAKKNPILWLGAQSSSTIVYDSKRKLVWGFCQYRKTFVLKLDPETLTVSEKAGGPAAAASDPGGKKASRPAKRSKKRGKKNGK